ncbi:FHA domain-containing protein [Acinetobacter sp. B5B]|uniref:FHA domain-containing protein n=1 Tax=Acinetobacter baretiae TaxID=2605383 RepID=UPI0018C1EC08|nr:FHA domain-containing protein [Acinetobacter baretiae]MBF7681726.1 FHA domain-containing protein [Acinetobacter baretiae]
MNEILAMKWNLTPISEELSDQNTIIQQDVLVGRHAACDLILQDAKISRKHAVFIVKKENLWLEDLQSSNGTFVNDEKIEVATQLKGDEKIQFADLVFQLESVEEQIPVVEKTAPITPEKPTIEPDITPAPTAKKEEPITSKAAESVSSTSDTQPVKQNKPQAMIFIVIALIIAFIAWMLLK